ncbi:hypothetical protein [Roseibium aestuarii]|uniref:Uncharacterized protein n=1 Tax=Roseibium aestuarii TaxID=2600299 RepID=A0ABW4K0U9_9HYPH|nr:hypothetical protein [Roseibium aestuarii]
MTTYIIIFFVARKKVAQNGAACQHSFTKHASAHRTTPSDHQDPGATILEETP